MTKAFSGSTAALSRLDDASEFPSNDTVMRPITTACVKVFDRQQFEAEIRGAEAQVGGVGCGGVPALLATACGACRHVSCRRPSALPAPNSDRLPTQPHACSLALSLSFSLVRARAPSLLPPALQPGVTGD